MVPPSTTSQPDRSRPSRGARGGRRRAPEAPGAVAEQPVTLSWASPLRATNMFVQKKQKKGKNKTKKRRFAQGDSNRIHPPRLRGCRDGHAASPCPLALSWCWGLRRSEMLVAMERANGRAGGPWRGSAGLSVLPGAGGDADGDAGALNLLLRKRVAQETSWSLSPARCSAAADFPRPRAAATADGGVRPPPSEPKAGSAGFARPGRNGRPCAMAPGLEQPRDAELGGLHGQHRAGSTACPSAGGSCPLK